MVQKRPFDGKEAFEVCSKHPRQMEHGNQLFSSLVSGLSEDASLTPHFSGGNGVDQSNTGGQKPASGVLTKHQGSAEDVQCSGPGYISISSWPTSSTSEEDSQSGTPVHEPVYLEYLFPDHPSRQLYSLLMVYPPQKSVPIGLNHQADIPAWGSLCAKETSNHISKCEVVLGSEHIVGNEYEKILMGTSVIPMPDLEPSAYTDGKVGNGRTDCLCEDRGSVRCVRQHIIEAREELGKYLGQEKFVQLGFLDMGEVVSDKWSDKEEQLLHKIVCSNPASLGKNFWGILSTAFPSRTRKEIVSYYFNVFVVRKRALQNRCRAMNIDSDNDEWRGGDDSDNNETEMSVEDKDSVVESPEYHEDFGYNERKEYYLRAYEEDAVDGESKDFVCATNISEALAHPSSQLQDGKGDGELQDDSCTSSDTGVVGSRSQVKADNEDHNHWPSCSSSYNEVRNGYGGVNEFTLEPSSAKVWDATAAGYTSYRNKVDFLPTCSMIKEVFGDGKS